jgi:Lipocalin-like domain
MAALGFASIVTLSVPALAQTAKDVVGTWQQVANVNIATDGKRTDTFGANPVGMAIFSADGHFMIINGRNDLPKFAANSRIQGTADENAAVVRGSIALFGTYSVADKVLNFKIEQSTYPNWSGTESKRNILMFTGDEMKWSLAASIGGQSQSEVTWKRIK